MFVQVDSLSMIYELRTGDVLLDSTKSENYVVVEINNGHIIVCLQGEPRALKTVYVPTILKDKWKVKIGQMYGA
jgi:hypothetical protein